MDNPVANPIQWLLSRFPGGDPAIVAVVVIAVVIAVGVAGRGAAWTGPATLLASVAALGLLAAVGIASPEVSVIMVVLALLIGLAMMQLRRV